MIKDLDLNLIKIFICVYENKSILAASKKMYVSQPAISNSIKKLEKFLQGDLFVRRPKGVISTSEGDLFYHSCKSALNALQQGVNNFGSFAKLEKGTLNIGSSSTIIRYLLTPFITTFSQKYPNINISISDGISSQLTKYLNKGSVDLAIMSQPFANEEIYNINKITRTHDCFICNTKFDLKKISAQELAFIPLIVQKRSSNNRDAFEKMCLANNIVLSPKYEMSSFGLITDFVAEGMGIGFTIKEFILKDIKNGRIKELETDLTIKPREVVVLTRKESVNSFAAKIFIKELIEYYNPK